MAHGMEEHDLKITAMEIGYLKSLLESAEAGHKNEILYDLIMVKLDIISREFYPNDNMERDLLELNAKKEHLESQPWI